ncbi:reverse transcriptase domain-containing protein [Enterobacter hormaechei]|uniref:reverse transcriptase domain-containing protein n=1 Tax=Enterobacter hormaechei TaxID=158836 RepID=UPI0023E37469|nr:reverse transcriptase domain-containing protein [Enterobacter hormaechei]MDF3675426.1 reverse transcriptase domain-containing protein [Enterobacter hormaechei]
MPIKLFIHPSLVIPIQQVTINQPTSITHEKIDLCKEFSEQMNKEFEMSMFGEIKFFVGLQIQQNKNGIYITQSKYIKEILIKFGMEDCKPVGTPMCTGIKLTKEDEILIII